MIQQYLTNALSNDHFHSSWIINSNQLEQDLEELKNFIKLNLLNSNCSLEFNPDFYLLQNQAGAKSISIEQVRELQHFLLKTAFNNLGVKVAIIYEADLMNLNAANGCLKILEEPTKNTYIFLLTAKSSLLIDTIKSRCTYLDTTKISLNKINEDNYAAFLNLVLDDDLQEKIKLIGELKNKDKLLWLAFCNNVNNLLSKIIKKINKVDIDLNIKENEFLLKYYRFPPDYLLDKFAKINQLITNTSKYDLDMSASFLIILNEF